MKKLLSVMLAVMMVLSTVSFAAPSAFGALDAVVEAPATEVAAPEAAEDADLMIDHNEPFDFSFEFDTAADLKKLTLRNGYNNALGASYATVENGALKLTFKSADPQFVVRDTGFVIPSAVAKKGAVTALEFKVRFTGLPTTETVLKLDNGGQRTFRIAEVQFPQTYVWVDGNIDTRGEKNFNALKNNEWMIFRYTAEELGIENGDLTNFRLDMYDFMPDGATAEFDYIRFEGNKYESLGKYDVEFDSADDIGTKARVITNNGVNTVTWNNEGYMTIKSVPIEGYEATWDQQIFVDTVSPATALPAGVVDEIIVRMRFRNLPTETKKYTVSGRDTTALNPAKMAGYVHIDAYGATKWMEKLQSNNKNYENVVDGQWFERRLDAETFFPGGMAYVRLDTPYPLPAGVEVDVDYIRFVGDNDKVPASEWEGEYGDLVLEIDFEKLSAGKPGEAFTYDMKSGGAANGNFVANYGGKVNPGFSASNQNVYFRNETGNADIEIKEDTAHGKYVQFTITGDAVANPNNPKNVWDLSTYNTIKPFTEKDGYFVLTYDLLSPKDGHVLQSHWNRSHTAEDTVKHATKHVDAVANEWTKIVDVYDFATIGTSTHKPPIASITEVDHILLYNKDFEVGETYAFDNIRLYWVPKSVNVSLVGGENGGFDLKDVTVCPTMTFDELAASLPEYGTKRVAGFSRTEGGEAVDGSMILGVSYPTSLYCVWEDIVTLEGSNEYNTADDIAKVLAIQARVGGNNAKTIKEQFVLDTEDGVSYLKMENEAASGATGCITDYGFVVTSTPFSKETVKEISIKMRVKGLPETATDYYCAGHGTCAAGTAHRIDPSNCNYVEFVYWNAAGTTVKQDYRRANLKGNEDWFILTIPASEFPYDEISKLRFDPFGDYAPNGSSVEVDYIRFYPYPEPDAEAPEARDDETAARFAGADEVDENGKSLTGIRFMASVSNATDEASVDIGWVITTDLYWNAAYNTLTVEAAETAGGKVKVAYQRQNGEDKANYFDTQVDNENVFAAVLYNIPAANALNYVLVRPFVKTEDDYLYGETIFTCLYDEMVYPYITFFEDEDTIDYLIEEGISYEDAASDYFEYNADYYALADADQAYVANILVALLG